MEMISLIAASVAMVVGVGAIAAFGGGSTRRQALRTVLHAAVPLIAAIYYALSAWGFARPDVDGPDAWFSFRYVGWAITSTLLLAGLAITACPSGRRPYGLIAAIVFADLAMILAGAVTESTSGWTSTLWFCVGILAFVALLALIWLPLREVADTGHPLRKEIFVRHAGLLTTLWSLYPLAFLLGPSGAGLAGVTAMVILYALLDLAAKVGYGLAVVLEDQRLAAMEPAERTWPPAPDQRRTRAFSDAADAKAGEIQAARDPEPADADDRAAFAQSEAPPAEAEAEAEAARLRRQAARQRARDAARVAASDAAAMARDRISALQRRSAGVPAATRDAAALARDRFSALQRRSAGVPAATRDAAALARDRLLDLHHRSAGVRTAARQRALGGAAASRRVAGEFAQRMSGPLERSKRYVVRAGDKTLFVVQPRVRRITTAPAPPPVDVTLRHRRRPPVKAKGSWPFGRLTKEDAVPVAILAGSLLAIALQSKREEE